jgi:hypothetical protein
VRPAYGNPKDGSAMVYYTLAQGRIHPYRTELLEALVPGVRWAFRRLDRDGREIGLGAVDYPPARVIAGLYERARANGVGGLRPCGGRGPPIVALPTPLPPPPPPKSPAELDAEACRFFQRQEQLAAVRKPGDRARVRTVGLGVDCRIRSVRRILQTDSIRRRERPRLAAAVQSLSDRYWCSTGVARRMMERGWTFGTELRAPGDPNAISATTRRCPS